MFLECRSTPICFPILFCFAENEPNLLVAAKPRRLRVTISGCGDPICQALLYFWSATPLPLFGKKRSTLPFSLPTFQRSAPPSFLKECRISFLVKIGFQGFVSTNIVFTMHKGEIYTFFDQSVCNSESTGWKIVKSHFCAWKNCSFLTIKDDGQTNARRLPVHKIVHKIVSKVDHKNCLKIDLKIVPKIV